MVNTISIILKANMLVKKKQYWIIILLLSFLLKKILILYTFLALLACINFIKILITRELSTSNFLDVIFLKFYFNFYKKGSMTEKLDMFVYIFLNYILINFTHISAKSILLSVTFFNNCQLEIFILKRKNLAETIVLTLKEEFLMEKLQNHSIHIGNVELIIDKETFL